eukprot:534261-Prorocentrum_lima.AAC.1
MRTSSKEDGPRDACLPNCCRKQDWRSTSGDRHFHIHGGGSYYFPSSCGTQCRRKPEGRRT